MRDGAVSIDMTIEEATEAWLSRYTSANTRAAYSSDVRAFLNWLGDEAAAIVATTDELNEYRAERESRGISPATIDRQFAALRAFYAAACEVGLCAQNPFGARSQATAATSSTSSLTAEDVARLEQAAAHDPRTAVLVQLLLAQGMRLVEILGLDHADVSGPRTARRLRVPRHGGVVSVVLDPAGSRSLDALERTTGSPGPLFLGPARGRAGSVRLTRFGADHLLKQAAAAAGIDRPVSANVLRRTHVTNAQRERVPIDDIRQTMGHLDVRTTRRYLTPADVNQPTNNPERS